MGNREDKILNHGYRVALLAKELGKTIGLSEKEIEHIYITGLNHDIGKQYLDIKILNKKGVLTEREKIYIKMHVLLSTSTAIEKKMDVYIVKGISHHHENFDGTGYPYNLKGNEIPIQSRILRIVDEYDNLMMDTFFGKGLRKQKAIKTMDKDIHKFDQDIYLEFKKMIDNYDIYSSELKAVN
ncbi:HD-GYP domain-containing protein [Tepidibacter hydrothermalis]|uniref:HD domain-containing phosphohydrolase n=1 Tax=Tepidibacter hydrothermalis TaxID=3036126 RepID=A0ABY8EDK5_9FIRM|nr:HD domain-containing phosphohydrolase [Tepidibacter hydrothermalis]WFD10997.1 HD domain-containing phosphohydrolase [Tepidibacter hydrothermalis]